mgnify:CR=1 FL=1
MTFIIAEAGVNHNGSIELARHLISVAKACGADAVKFQLFRADQLGRPEIKHLELTYANIIDLYGRCRAQEIEFMCTPFDLEAMSFLVPLLKRVKIASGCIANVPLLEAACDSHLPVVLSTGMAKMGDVAFALDILGGATLLHCTSAYPCPLQDVNLRAMRTLGDHFKLPVGYSDHTDGIIVPLAAVGMGAGIIEKHLTLSRAADGPDHLSSLEPKAFAEMVSHIRSIDVAMGDGDKRPMPSEDPVRQIWGR